jgi:hypothetical protein
MVDAVAEHLPGDWRGHPRSSGSERGLAPRHELLEAVADDVATHGLNSP